MFAHLFLILLAASALPVWCYLLNPCINWALLVARAVKLPPKPSGDDGPGGTPRVDESATPPLLVRLRIWTAHTDEEDAGSSQSQRRLVQVVLRGRERESHLGQDEQLLDA